MHYALCTMNYALCPLTLQTSQGPGPAVRLELSKADRTPNLPTKIIPTEIR